MMWRGGGAVLGDGVDCRLLGLHPPRLLTPIPIYPRDSACAAKKSSSKDKDATAAADTKKRAS